MMKRRNNKEGRKEGDDFFFVENDNCNFTPRIFFSPWHFFQIGF